MAKLKNGGFRVSVPDEDILWTDRKRILGLPLTFTKYLLTESKLTMRKGFFNIKEDEVRLYRVRDLRFCQTLADRIFKVGTVHLETTDASLPRLDLQHVQNPRKLKEVLSSCVEESRKRNGIRATEVMGGGLGGDGDAPFVDENQNGIDDALEHC